DGYVILPQRLFQGFNQLQMRHRFERACWRRRPDQRELLARDQIRIDMRKQLSMFHFILLMWGIVSCFIYRIGRKEDTYEALARNKQKGASKELFRHNPVRAQEATRWSIPPLPLHARAEKL